MNTLPNPIEGSLIFENKYLYVCLANFPITKGHSVVVWKEDVTDIHLLKRIEYEHLMDVVDQARNAILSTLGVEKVYLIYMDEVKHVHWHLVPRYDEEGFNVLTHNPKPLLDVSLAKDIIKHWKYLS
jgi:diadenosine tetraphosphate (Ap4A) HIT family hydrolase